MIVYEMTRNGKIDIFGIRRSWNDKLFTPYPYFRESDQN